MATSHKRRIVAFNAGVWAFALGSAVALGYVLNRPHPVREAPDVTAPDTCDGVLVIPPITIVGSRSEGPAAAGGPEQLPDVAR